MIKQHRTSGYVKPHWVLTLAVMAVLVIVACGSAAQPAEPPAAAPADTAMNQPTAIPQAAPVEAPAQTTTAKDSITIVMPAEPGSINSWDPNCNATLDTAVCNEIVNEPFTWITSDNFEVVPLSGIESWEQVDVDSWIFKLRSGVKFHNGEPWNATAAKAAVDQNGDVSNSSQSYTYHGPISGTVVDEMTLQVDCGTDCPILPRGMIFSRMQAPAWYAAASEEDRGRNIIGIGPYQLIEWRPGIDIQMEAYEGYVPNPDTSIVDGQPAKIKYLTNVWRGEELVRASMIQTGEAEWAADIGFDKKDQVPQWKQSGTSEVYALVPDTM